MISIKDYAKETGVSYEAVRQRIKRYQAELDGHIHRQGRTQFLDDVAVAFLNDHRLQNPTVLYDRAAGEEFRELKEELAEMTALAKDYWDQLKKKDAIMAKLVDENAALRLKADSVARLEADNEASRQKVAEAEKEKGVLEGFIRDAKDEIAVLSDEKAEAERKAKDAANDAQKAQDELTAAQGRERELREYLVALEAWNALKWHQRRNKKKHPKPAAPEWVKED